MERSFRILLAAVCLTSSTAVAAVNVKVTLDSTRVTLGDWVHATWYVDHAPQDTIEAPAVPRQWGAFEILDHDFQNDARQARLRMTLAVYDSLGKLWFNRLPLIVKRPGRIDTLFYPGFQLEVVSVLSARDTTFHPLKGLHPVEVPLDWRYVAGGVLLAALLAGGIYWLVKKRPGRKQKSPEYVPPEKAHEWALRMLSRLKRSDLLERGEVKAYYSELSNILRGYLERRYLVPALEMTTSEIQEALQRTAPEALQHPELLTVLQRADLVKFAKYIPPRSEVLQDHEAAVAFVKATKLTPVPDQAGADSAHSTSTLQPTDTVSHMAPTAIQVEQKEEKR